MANTSGKLKLDKVDLTKERLMSGFFNAYNSNMDKVDTEVTGLSRSVGELGSKDRVIMVSYKYGGDLVNLNNVDVSYLLAYSNTSLNAPAGTGSFWYVETIFFDHPNGNRMQTATTYTGGITYRRVFHNGTWQPWRPMTAT